MEQSGTAAWVAQQTLILFEGVPTWGLQAAIAVLATVFTLVISNVGATVLLVPLAVNIAIGVGADRIANALGAMELLEGDLIVVDAGTATTVDCVGAGPGERVMITSDGRSAREFIGVNKTPIRWTTVGICDE